MAGNKPLFPVTLDDITDSDCAEQSTDGFHQVKKKKTMDRQNSSAATTSTGSKHNRKQAVPPSSSDPESNRLLQNNKFALLPVENGNSEPIAKKERVPPLFTPLRDMLKLQAELANLSLEPLYKKCSKGTKILCSNMEEYNKVSDLLATHQVPYYTHDNPATKPLKVVLRGLPALAASTVKAELEQVGFKVEAVFPMNRRSQTVKDDPYRDELFLVHFTKRSTTLGALRNTKHLFHTIIQWEPYRPQHRDVTQCTICLWFGHGTRNCKMIPRCDKCAGAHRSSTCLQPDDSEPKCANCDQNHRATSRSCPKRAEFIRIRKAASTANQNGRHRKPPPAHTPDQFPPIRTRHVVPVLEPLPLPNSSQPNRSTPAAKFSAQPRLAAAAALSNQGPTPPPGLSYAGVTSGTFAGSTEDDPQLSTEELVKIISAAFEIQRKYKTRSQQLAAIVALISNNGP